MLKKGSQIVCESLLPRVVGKLVEVSEPPRNITDWVNAVRESINLIDASTLAV